MESDRPLEFSYSTVAQEITCAPDAISGLGEWLDRVGAGAAMVVCGPSILQGSDAVYRVQEALGHRCVGLFSGVSPHSPVEVLHEAVEVARSLGPDALVSVGGSTHDTTKGIATMLTEGGDIHDYEVIFQPPDRVTIPDLSRPKVPIVAVSTTMGCAELSRGAGFTDRALGRKILVSDSGTIPRFIVIDGKALATTPSSILVSTAMGQFRIAVETVYSRNHNPISDGMALAAISMLAEHLPHGANGDVDRLLRIKTAASMASLAGVRGLGLNTAMAHHVGALYDVPHGEANAILLPHTMRFNLEASGQRPAASPGGRGHGSGHRRHGPRRGGAGRCRRRGLPVPGPGNTLRPEGGRSTPRRAGADSGGHPPRPGPGHQPGARYRRGAHH